MSSISSRMGKKTVELSHISKKYDDKVLINDFSYNFLRTDRIGIIGPNGCGKSTLLNIITGNIAPDEGTVEMGSTISVGYFSQENEYMDESMLAIEYVKEVAEFIDTTEGKMSASNLMERFLFDGTKQWTRIEKLSGGEKRRLYLMRVLIGSPNVLILDEPTNDLDIATLTVLEDFLDTFLGIIIVVSHDRYFLDRVVRRIFAYEGNGRLKQYEGGYSDYILASEPVEPVGKNAGKSTDIKESGAANTQAEKSGKKTGEKTLKFTFKEQREYETIDEDIEALENRLSEIDDEMAASASNYSKLNELMAEKEKTQAELDEKMDRWVYLNDLAEQIEAQKK